MRCTDCQYDPPDVEPDKDCICGGAQTVDAQIRGLHAAVDYWRDKYIDLQRQLAKVISFAK